MTINNIIALIIMGLLGGVFGATARSWKDFFFKFGIAVTAYIAGYIY